MTDEITLTSIAFVAISLFAFAWMVRLSFQMRHTVRHHSDAVHDRLDDIEESLLGVMKNVDTLEVDLNDKADHHYVEKRINGLLELIQTQKKPK
ncbi:MAG: hypothetical protein AABW54_00410 [Candidatus Micrarchaeota archaeon]